MPTRRITQLSFGSGELDPRLFGRLDIERRESAVAKARNLFLSPGGAAKLRPGARYRWDLTDQARLIGWEHKDDSYLLAVTTDGNAYLYQTDATLVATLPTLGVDLTEAEIEAMDWASDSTRMVLLFGGARRARLIDQEPDTGDFRLQTFIDDDDQPFYRFQDHAVTLTPSATTGSITITASADYFTADHDGRSLLLYTDDDGGADGQRGYRVEITAFTNATTVTATVHETLPGTTATAEWEEQAFGDGRGWPTAVALHQQRLVLSGGTSLGNVLFFSEIADISKFRGPSTLTDADAFAVAMGTEQGAVVRHLRSQGPLIILTNGVEFIVAEQPVTADNIAIQKQSTQGAASELRPVEASGSLIFLRGKKDDALTDVEQPLLNFRFDELRQVYVPDDIGILGQHLIDAPREMILQTSGRFDTNNRIYVLNDSGDLVVMHLPRDDRPGATLLEFGGTLTPYTMATVGGRMFLAANFNSAHRVFELDPDYQLDASEKGTVASGSVTGLDHLNGLSVRVREDDAGGALHGPYTVTANAIDVSGDIDDATAVEVGLFFNYQLRTLELEAAPPTLGTLKSVVEVSGQFISSRGVKVKAIYDDGTVNDSEVEAGEITGSSATTGHRRVHVGGWGEGAQVELYDTGGRPFELLSLNIDVEF